MKNRPEMLGDQPVAFAKTAKMMQSVAEGLDKVFNATRKGKDKQIGFVLLVYEYGDDPHIDRRCNYVSNGADRKDIVVLMKEMIRRFEGAPEVEGRA